MANSTTHASLPYPIKNARFTVAVPYLDADGDPTDPTTPDTEFSLDAGSFADTTEEVTTITGGNGMGYLTFTGAETNGSLLAAAFKVASGPKNTLGFWYPRNLPIFSSGTLSAGSAGGGTLQAALGYDIAGCFIRTTGGTGGGGTGGANNQARRIATYTQSTGAFTVIPNWETTVSTDTTYDLLLPDNATFGALKALNPTTAGRTLDVSAAGEAGLDINNIAALTAGPLALFGILESGTAQSATATTLVGRAAATNDIVKAGNTLAVYDSTLTYWQFVMIDSVSGDTFTIAAWPVATPGATITYLVFGTPPVSANLPIPCNPVQLGGDAQSLTDLKDFADAGYDPSTNKLQGVVLVDTVTTYTGNTVQTGDAFARIGATGSGLTSLATQASVNTIDDFLDTEIAAILAAVDTEVAAIKAKTDQLTFTVANQVDSNALTVDEDEILDDQLTDSVPADGTLPTVRQALYMLTQFMFERSVSGTTLTVRKADGSTSLMTFTLSDATSPVSITRAT